MAQFIVAPFIPLTVVSAAGAGLFYGAYDVTKESLELAMNKPHKRGSFSNKVLTFTSGLGVSSLCVYARVLVNPPPDIPCLDPQTLRSNPEWVRSIRRSAHVIRYFPYPWYASTTAVAGAITGAVVALFR